MVKKLLKSFIKISKDVLNRVRIEKVIKRKGNKLYVKWKDYDNLLNSWIDKKKYR